MSTLLMLTGCEGSELYKVGAPSWLEGKLDSIANARTPDAGLYNVGSTALNSPFWTLGKSHVVPAGGKLEMLIDLTVNPDNKYFKNFYVVITNDVSINPRGSGYYEYGVMRFDNDLNKNSEWGTDDKTMFTKEDRQQNISANFTNTSGADEIDPSVQDMNGLVKVVVDRTGGGLIITFEGEKCKKTYTRAKLESHNLEATNENIRITLGVEGSFVNVIESNIDPVDDSIDRDPVSMTLKGVQKKYLVGTDMANIIKGITADVDFGESGIKNIEGSKLTIDVVPDLNSVGQKTLVAAYNKTAKGEMSKKTVIASATFEMVDKMYTCIGKTDNTRGFREEATENFKVAPGQTYVNYFTNYTDGVNNWDNFIIQLCKADGTEYCFVRADNWGLGGSYWDGCQSCDYNWDIFATIMDGAKVTTYITNNGDGTADIKAVVVGSDGKTYTQKYKFLNTWKYIYDTPNNLPLMRLSDIILCKAGIGTHHSILCPHHASQGNSGQDHHLRSVFLAEAKPVHFLPVKFYRADAVFVYHHCVSIPFRITLRRDCRCCCRVCHPGSCRHRQSKHHENQK